MRRCLSQLGRGSGCALPGRENDQRLRSGNLAAPPKPVDHPLQVVDVSNPQVDEHIGVSRDGVELLGPRDLSYQRLHLRCLCRAREANLCERLQLPAASVVNDGFIDRIHIPKSSRSLRNRARIRPQSTGRMRRNAQLHRVFMRAPAVPGHQVPRSCFAGRDARH